MHHTRMKLYAAALLAGAIAIGCNSDRTTGAGAASPSLKEVRAPAPPKPGKPAPTTPETVTVATRRVPLPADILRWKMIDSKGGTLEIKEAGLRLVVPPNAVLVPTVFTVTALEGSQIAYEFGPAGSRFDSVPLRVEQDLKDIWLPDDNSAVAGYFSSRSQLSEDGTVSTLSEPLIQTGKDGTLTKIIFDVYHFSGYVLASGRRTTY